MKLGRVFKLQDLNTKLLKYVVPMVCLVLTTMGSSNFAAAQKWPFFMAVAQAESVEKVPPLPAELRQSNQFVLLNFYASWCPTCQKLEPFIRSLEKEVSPDVHVIYLDTDVPNNRPYLKLYQIHSTPNYILFNPSGQAVYKMTETLDPKALRLNIFKAIGKKPPKN